MGHTRVFGFLAIALCLVCSVYANTSVSYSDAKEVVDNGKKATDDLLKSAKSQLNSATYSSEKVELLKERAERVASKAEEAAKDNKKAEEIAKKARSAADTVQKLYADGSEAVQKAVDCMKELLSEAEALKKKSVIRVVPNEESTDDYSNTKDQATTVAAAANELKEKLKKALTLVSAAFTVERKMEKPTENAQLARYHVDAFVAVAKIDTMLKDADATIQKIKQTREAANDTVKEMKKRNQNVPDDKASFINALCLNAGGDLSTASRAVAKAKKAKEAMQQLKESADAALLNVKEQTDPEEAEKEADNANYFAKQIAKKAPEIRSALESAEIAASNAESRKQTLLRELSKSNSQPTTNNDKVTKNPQQRTNDGVTKPASKGTEQTVTQNPEQDANHGVTKPASKGTEQIVTQNPEQDANHGVTTPASKGREQTVTQNPKQDANDGEKYPVGKRGIAAFDAYKDGTINVSLSPLLVLLVCAALH